MDISNYICLIHFLHPKDYKLFIKKINLYTIFLFQITFHISILINILNKIKVFFTRPSTKDVCCIVFYNNFSIWFYKFLG